VTKYAREKSFTCEWKWRIGDEEIKLN